MSRFRTLHSGLARHAAAFTVFAGCLLTALPAAAQFLGDEYYNQGVDLAKAGRHREAIPYFTKAIEMDARNADAWADRGTAWGDLREYGKAISDLSTSIQISPSDSTNYYNRGRMWLAVKEYDKAIADCDSCLAKNPGDPDVRKVRADAWTAKGEHQKALADLDTSIRLSPSDADAYCVRAAVLRKMKQYDRAVADYNAALRLKPTDAFCLNAAAWFRATCPADSFRNGERAVSNATRACELSKWKESAYVDTLAAAYAESQQFDKAVVWQKKAIALASEATRDELLPGCDRRLM